MGLSRGYVVSRVLAPGPYDFKSCHNTSIYPAEEGSSTGVTRERREKRNQIKCCPTAVHRNVIPSFATAS
jgi:hypothetical protein